VIADAEGGDYTLQYKFEGGPPATCPALELQLGPQSGSLAGVSSCHAVEGMQDVYTLSVTASFSAIINLSSDDFGGSLILRDGKDNFLARSDATDSQQAQIIADLQPGSYSLAVASKDPGAYTVDYAVAVRDPAPCQGPQRMGTNSTFFGTLGRGTCPSPNGQGIDTYEFTTPSDGMAGIFMTSSEVDSYLTLTDTQGSTMRRDDNGYGGLDSMILQWLPAGTYRFNASASSGSQNGRYRVDVLFAAGDRPAGCLPSGDLKPGVTQGSFYINSCQYEDDTFADVYRLVLMDPADLNIKMASSDVDSYLVLLDDKGNVIDVDNDSGGGSDALLTTSVDAGTYYLVAKAFVDQGYVAGTYTLLVQ
jgi:hypothetical protein